MQPETSRTTTAAAGALAAALTVAALAPVRAAGTHPVTGEKLADDQTFTYRLLDQFPTLDPQINQETSGYHVIRDLFRGPAELARISQCAVKGALSQWVRFPPGNCRSSR